jgi:hypothetical protein
VTTQELEQREKEREEDEGDDDGSEEQERADSKKRTQEQEDEGFSRSRPCLSFYGQLQKKRAEGQGQAFGEHECHESAGRMQGEGGELKEPMHVEPRPPQRTHRKGIRPKERACPHHFSPSGQVPPNVSVSARSDAGTERSNE